MLGTLVEDLQRSEEGRLHQFFLRRLRNAADAADATQDTFMRLLSAAPRTAIQSPQAYLFSAARNIAIDRERAARRRARIECPVTDEEAVGNIASDDPSQEAALIDRERLDLFEKALLELPQRVRTALLLSRIEGLPYPAIAKRLGVSPNTVYNDVRVAMTHCMTAMARLDRD